MVWVVSEQGEVACLQKQSTLFVCVCVHVCMAVCMFMHVHVCVCVCVCMSQRPWQRCEFVLASDQMSDQLISSQITSIITCHTVYSLA